MKKKILIIISFLLMLIPFFINSYNLLRMVSLLCGIILLGYLISGKKKINIFMVVYIVLIIVSTYSVDYLLSCLYVRVPIYSFENKSNEYVSTYNSILYRVYNCNGINYFDNNYQKEFSCDPTLISNTDINKVLNEPENFYKENKKDFIKVTGKISKINGNSSLILRSYKIDDDNTLNGYVVFNESSSLEIKINNKMDISHYKIYDYITVVGEIYKYENNTIYMDNVVIEDKDLYSNYKLSVIKPTSCHGLEEYTEHYYTYCLANIYVDYGIDKYELSYALKDKKITFDNLKNNYLAMEEKDEKDLYTLDNFKILVCNEDKIILLNKDTKNEYNVCEMQIDE